MSNRDDYGAQDDSGTPQGMPDHFPGVDDWVEALNRGGRRE